MQHRMSYDGYRCTTDPRLGCIRLSAVGRASDTERPLHGRPDSRGLPQADLRTQDLTQPAWSLDVTHRNRSTAFPISHQANSLLMHLTGFEQAMSAPSNNGDLKRRMSDDDLGLSFQATAGWFSAEQKASYRFIGVTPAQATALPTALGMAVRRCYISDEKVSMLIHQYN